MMLAEIDTLALLGSVAALVLGLQAVVCLIGIEWVKAKLEPMMDYLKQKNLPHPITEYSLCALSDVVVEMEHTLELHTGLIHELVNSSHVAKTLPKLSEENKRMRDCLEKAMQELMLISTSEETRRSAIQQLSQMIGDQQSLAKMKIASGFFPDDDTFKSGIEDLNSRITEYPSKMSMPAC